MLASHDQSWQVSDSPLAASKQLCALHQTPTGVKTGFENSAAFVLFPQYTFSSTRIQCGNSQLSTSKELVLKC